MTTKCYFNVEDREYSFELKYEGSIKDIANETKKRVNIILETERSKPIVGAIEIDYINEIFTIYYANGEKIPLYF